LLFGGLSGDLLELGAHGLAERLGGGERAHHHRELVDLPVVEVQEVASLELLEITTDSTAGCGALTGAGTQTVRPAGSACPRRGR